jgi:acyl-coenzyme A synthetase/AMP-(fatty) acid ligase
LYPDGYFFNGFYFHGGDEYGQERVRRYFGKCATRKYPVVDTEGQFWLIGHILDLIKSAGNKGGCIKEDVITAQVVFAEYEFRLRTD